MRRAAYRPAVPVLAVVVIVATLGGCSSNPSSPSSPLGSYYIAAEYCYCPAADPPGVSTGAFVSVRDGSSGGPYVDGLDVTFGGVGLVQTQYGYYWNAVNVLAGRSYAFSVSTGGRTLVSQSEIVPYAPFSLVISGGQWDASEYTASNALSWQNPATIGDDILLKIYDWNGHSAELLYSGYLGDAAATSTTISNQQLSYFQGIDTIRCLVYQCNWEPFADQPYSSYALIASGTYADWPVSEGVSD